MSAHSFLSTPALSGLKLLLNSPMTQSLPTSLTKSHLPPYPLYQPPPITPKEDPKPIMADNFHAMRTEQFHGDNDKEQSDDFLAHVRTMFRLFKITQDADKVEFFQDQLAGGSPEMKWFKNMSSMTKPTFAMIASAFEITFPVVEPVQWLKEEIQEEMAGLILHEDSLGQTVSLGGKIVPVHTAHAAKLMKLARKADMQSGNKMVGVVRAHLPSTLQNTLASLHTTWAAFTDAIAAVDAVKM